MSQQPKGLLIVRIFSTGFFTKISHNDFPVILSENLNEPIDQCYLLRDYQTFCREWKLSLNHIMRRTPYSKLIMLNNTESYLQ